MLFDLHMLWQASWAFSTEEGITKLAVMLELVFRSLNNLLERFHHSTVFYILLSPDWHVPFQAYVMCPILLIAVIVLQVSRNICALRSSCADCIM